VNSGTAHAINSAIAMANATTVSVASSAQIAINGAISGASGLNKAGAGTLVFAGANTYSGATTIDAGLLQIGNAGTRGALSAAGAITGSAGATLAFNRTNTVTQGTDFGSTIGGAMNLSQLGSGTLLLNAANTYSGTTAVAAGMLRIGNGGSVNAASLLALSGAQLVLDRNDGFTQAFAGTLLSGAASVAATAGNTLNLGAITRQSGGALAVAATGSVITSSPNTTAGILGGITFGGTTWAVANGTSPITGLASYTLTSAAQNTPANYLGANVDVDSSPNLAGAIAAGSLRFASAAPRTLALDGASTVDGGILVTPGVGGNLSTITGGTLAGSAGDLAVTQNNTAGDLTIASVIADSGAATGLTKAGAGLLAVAAANTYSGPTSISAGTLQIGAGGAAGALSPASGIGGAAGGTLAFNRTTTLTQGSDFGTIGGAVNVAQTSAGTTVLIGTNTYTGTTSVNAGTLQVGSGGTAGSIAASAVVTGSAGGTLAFNRSDVVTQGTHLPGVIAGAVNVAQIGTGTLSLVGANTYTGTTSINAGTLQVGNGATAGSIASSAAITPGR